MHIRLGPLLAQSMTTKGQRVMKGQRPDPHLGVKLGYDLYQTKGMPFEATSDERITMVLEFWLCGHFWQSYEYEP